MEVGEERGGRKRERERERGGGEDLLVRYLGDSIRKGDI